MILRILQSKRTWLFLLSALLAVSLAGNGWLMLKVLDYKGRVFLAREFPDSAPLRAEPDGRPLVWLAGDSRIEAWSLPDSPARRVINRGVSGFTARETLNRFRADTAAGSRPQTVIIQAGINDVLSAGYNRPSRLPPGVSAGRPTPERIMAQCLADLRALVEAARQMQCRVVLLTVFPPGPRDFRDWLFWTAELEAKVAELNTALRLLAGPEVTIVDAAALLASEGRTRAEYSADCLHLNAAGYRVLTEAVESVLAGPSGNQP